MLTGKNVKNWIATKIKGKQDSSEKYKVYLEY